MITTIDIVILVVIGLGVLQGLMRGFVKELASIAGLIAGLLLARALFAMVGERLAPALGTSTTVAQILAFVLIWVAVPLALAWVASLITRVLEVIHLGGLNRLLGAALGALKCVLIVGIAVYACEYIDPANEMIEETKKQESVLYEPVKEVTGIFFPVFKNLTEQLINQ